MRVTVEVNGQERTADVEPRLLPVDLIRDHLRLTGTHVGCDTSSCGACTVLLAGDPVKSCTMLAVQADGRDLMTVEGLASGAQLSPVQVGFTRGARTAVRLLYTRHDARGVGAAPAQP